ncbi:hypothetical protein SteCoe_34446 [Stentor coeruleus]|uniref:EGF-like domain-containing protein n=1 Tax=Stentor coeruleus TaxID=5963 RepID=A0A1R2AUQ5_9CILI|nr:hypothetical protein SteCoe_34446 [Stentor coeruleus]
MLMLLKIVALCLASCFGKLLIQYSLGKNFGQKIMDYSGNGMHAVNGNTSDIDSFDTIPTDRGAYFPKGLGDTYDYHILMMPNEYNNVTVYKFPDTFSIATWVMVLTCKNSVIFHRKTNVKLKFHENYSPLLKLVLPNSVLATEGLANTFMLSNFYADIWVFLVVTVEPNSAIVYANGVQTYSNTSTFIFDDGTDTHYTYLGGINGGPSMHGYMWSFALYSDIISQSNYATSNYIPGICLVNTCPSTCHGINDNGVTYCISNMIDWNTTGAGINCASGCNYGCSGSLCLDCKCKDKSCVIESNNSICWCPSNGSSNSTDCICNDGYYKFNDSCNLCNVECKTCSNANTCDKCIADYATPITPSGCFCMAGYYGSDLTTKDSCKLCHSDCLYCSEAKICTYCLALNTIPSTIEGCICKDGYYNNNPSGSISCITCNVECATCSVNDICLTCIALNAKPKTTQGCICNDGYYGSSLINSNSCIACYSECKTCSKDLICLTCIAQNAYANIIKGCTCNYGYYGSSLNEINSCLACYKECATCSQEEICDTCIAKNASPISVSKGCSCNNGYYGSNLIYMNSCIPCNNYCILCNESACIICNDPNAEPLGVLCKCKDGFYSEANSTSLVCLQCNKDCLTCLNSYECLVCVSSNAEPVSSNYTDNDIKCECKQGYYNSSNTTDLVCIACDRTCKSCSSADKCLECYYNYTNLEDGKCICPEHSNFDGNECICQSGFFIEESANGIFYCKACHSSCKECRNGMEDGCTKCYSDVILNNNYCNSCSSTLYYKNNTCNSCMTLCDSCNSSSTCNICEKNADLLDNTCHCKKGFKYKSNHCTEDYFSANLKTSPLNKLLLTFSENLQKPLTDYNYSLTIPNITSTTYTYTQTSSKSILIIPIFIEYIKAGTILELTIETYPLYSESNKQLDFYTYNSSLYEFKPIILNALTKEVAQRTEAATQVTVNSAIFCAILSNPATAWMLVNTIDLIQYFTLSKNHLTPGIRAFLGALGGFNIIPNLAEFIFSKNATSIPYMEALDSGIDTSMFWINTGQMFIFMLAGIFALPLLWIVYKLNMFGLNKKAGKMIQNYRYSFFIRFWIQSYLNIGISAFVQLHSYVSNPYQGYFNLLSGAFFSVISNKILFVLTLPLTFVGCFLNKTEIIEREREFISRWGSLFEELEQSNLYLQSQFYLFFFIRRFVYVIAQIYLNNYLFIQGILHISCSLLFLIYLAYYRPFISKFVLVSYFISEISTLLFFSLSFAYLFDINNNVENIIEMIIIGNIVLCLFVQFIICVIQLIQALKGKWIIYERKNALNFIENAKRIERERKTELTSG